MPKKAPAQPRPKLKPQRTCVLCRQVSEKRELIRFVRTSEEGVQFDPSGKRNGRGAYVCRDVTCWQENGFDSPEKALKRAYQQLEQALRTALTPDDHNHIRAAMLNEDHTPST